MSIPHLIFDNGERFPVILKDGVPDYWTTLYVTERLRVSMIQTSIENVLRNILHLRLWEEVSSRSLVEDFSQERFLSDDDILSIRDHCRLDARAVKKWFTRKQSKHVIELSFSTPSKIESLDVVSLSHSANRLSNIADFLHFQARTMLRCRANFISLAADIDKMKKGLKKQKPKGKRSKGLAADPDKKAPSPEIFAVFMKKIQIDAMDNPYKHHDIKVRNNLMFELLYETGMRNGELLGLQIGDIDLISQIKSVIIYRRHDDLIDPRPVQPVAKTLERRIPIKNELALKLRSYIMDVRSTIPNARKYPHLFVTHKKGEYQGRPVSDSTFRNRVLLPAVKSDMELFDEICRHGFRHDFNYRISQKVDAHNQRAKLDKTLKPISEKQEIQIRKRLCGWSSDESAVIYNQRHIDELAREFQLQDMQDISKYLTR